VNTKKIHLFLGIVLVLMAGVVFAEERHTFGDIARKLIVGTDILTRFFHFICVMVGIGLCVMTVSLYKMHQQNPKFMPLDRPILYFILGLVLISLPFWGNFIETGSTIEIKKKESKKYISRDIDAPLDWGNDYDH